MPPRNDRPRRSAPTRLGAEQLKWVAQNRQTPPPAQAIGPAARAEDIDGSGARRFAREVYDAIGALVDAPFRENCAFDDVHAGTVRILVKQPEMLYAIRSVWQARLTRELARMCRRGNVRKVVFAVQADDAADRPERGGVKFPQR